MISVHLKSFKLDLSFNNSSITVQQPVCRTLRTLKSFPPISWSPASSPPSPVYSLKPDWCLFIACFFMAQGESEWVCFSAGRRKTVQDYTLVFHSWARLCHSSPQSNKHMSLLILSALPNVSSFFFIWTSSNSCKYSNRLVQYFILMLQKEHFNKGSSAFLYPCVCV